jgi:hypothetical protein
MSISKKGLVMTKRGLEMYEEVRNWNFQAFRLLNKALNSRVPENEEFLVKQVYFLKEGNNWKMKVAYGIGPEFSTITWNIIDVDTDVDVEILAHVYHYELGLEVTLPEGHFDPA